MGKSAFEPNGIKSAAARESTVLFSPLAASLSVALELGTEDCCCALRETLFRVEAEEAE
jgi:hypothetical protein